LSRSQQNSQRTVTVIGGGVAGMSAACALAEAGLRVQLVEQRGYLGGRASSYLHPGVNRSSTIASTRSSAAAPICWVFTGASAWRS
jgi:heterodisulfide reductase subunit A-like polyferredoxin